MIPLLEKFLQLRNVIFLRINRNIIDAIPLTKILKVLIDLIKAFIQLTAISYITSIQPPLAIGFNNTTRLASTSNATSATTVQSIDRVGF